MLKIKYKGKEVEIKNTYFDLTWNDFELIKNDQFEKIYTSDELEVVKKYPELLRFDENEMKEFINSIEPINLINVAETNFFIDEIGNLTFGCFLTCLESINKGDIFECVLSVLIQKKYPSTNELNDFRSELEESLKQTNLYDVYCFAKFIQLSIEGQINLEKETLVYPVDIVKESLNVNEFFESIGVWHDFQNYMSESGKNEVEAFLTRYKYVYLWKSVKCAEANFSDAYRKQSKHIKK